MSIEIVFSFKDEDLLINVRTMTKEGEVFFRATDVANCLSIETHVMLRMVDSEDRIESTVLTNGGSQKASFLSESGLYTVLLRSNKEEAKLFRRWVTREVLPSIRKQGFYATEQLKAELAQKEQVILQLKGKKIPRGTLGYHYVPEVQPALENFEPTVLYRRVPNEKLNTEQLKAIEQTHTLRTLEGLIQKIVADNGHRACYDIFSSLFRNFIPE